ncbi:aminotransferase class I/II-fold pyridoxal phosphate-dependent enzyme [Wenxinia saemankumensis]|uniref:aspartate transaminase n=1 Tax=Wenxinia saemankumensis TaxID=1447782 RepID=A0A1M6BRL4_9RHOB|nr:aminotransferase class I/II-fold pyridoxal phosphate-dependent enzyme [Wenxinia saemankumensis]SHI51331.1 Aspartate/methionine/tyrosine aminotransferase [Wenxinia saemankumensis]
MTSTDRPARLERLRLPGRVAGASARDADLALIAKAPEGFLDTTHFDTIRFPPPDWAARAFHAAAIDGSRAYSPYRGHLDVREAVARNASALLGLPIDPEGNVILTAGTQSALFASISATAAEGGEIVLLSPEYLFDERMARFLGASVRHVPLDLAAASPDLDALEAAFAGGAGVFVFSHPNNPTGTVFDAATVSAIAQLAVAHDVTVVADELYCRLLHDGTPFRHIASEPGMAERTITLLGPSKTESLSGYRLGVAIGPAALIDQMEDVMSVTSLRAPAYAQSLLTRWLGDDADWLASRQPDLTGLRAMTRRALEPLDWLKVTTGQGTAYAWCDASALGLPSRELAERLLTDAAVLVSPGYQFGPDCEGCFRLCYARDEAGWSSALERMVGVLSAIAVEQGVVERAV